MVSDKGNRGTVSLEGEFGLGSMKIEGPMGHLGGTV